MCYIAAMEAIKKLLTDPGWWFTALFVGVIIAVIIAPAQKFITDWFYNIAAKSSEKWAERRKENIAHRERRIAVLVENPQLLISRAALNACRLIYVAALIGMCSLMINYAGTFSSQLPKWIPLIIGAMTGVSMIIVMFSFYSTTKSYIIMVAAYKRYAASCIDAFVANHQAAKEFSIEQE